MWNINIRQVILVKRRENLSSISGKTLSSSACSVITQFEFLWASFYRHYLRTVSHRRWHCRCDHRPHFRPGFVTISLAAMTLEFAHMSADVPDITPLPAVVIDGISWIPGPFPTPSRIFNSLQLVPHTTNIMLFWRCCKFLTFSGTWGLYIILLFFSFLSATSLIVLSPITRHSGPLSSICAAWRFAVTIFSAIVFAIPLTSTTCALSTVLPLTKRSVFSKSGQESSYLSVSISFNLVNKFSANSVSLLIWPWVVESRL